jgi:branched-chain amino acid transport system permease protein
MAAMVTRPFFWIITLVVAAFILFPALGDDVQLRESLALATIYITLASSLNLMLGYAGYINFGSIVFFGLGGYIGVGALAFIFGLGILRLRGPFFALSTIGIVEGVQAFVQNFEPWGGSAGIYISPEVFTPLGGPGRALWVIYFGLVATMGLSLYLSYGIKISKFGLGLLAIGQNEDAAAILGVPTPRYKAYVYSASAVLPAVAGGLYFFKSAFIQPSDAFDLSLSTEALVVAMLGGQGTVTGVALGAYLYEELRGYLLVSGTFSHFQLVISGVLLLLIVLFFPSGLMGFIHSRFPRTQKVLE